MLCRACQNDELVMCLDLGSMPLAGAYLPNLISEEKTYPLHIFVCKECSLPQISNAIHPTILFDEYAFSSSTVPPLVSHFSEYAQWLVNRFNPKTVVEFGANDGVLIRPLRCLGVRAIGIDASKNITKMASEQGLQVNYGYFNPTTAVEFLKEFGTADIITGSNVFAHNENPITILEAARILLSTHGYLCLEVMYAGDLLEKWQWDTLYHEHLTFYSLKTLQTCLSRAGFTIVHAERNLMHGGALRVVATPKKLAVDSSVFDILKYEKSIELNNPFTWNDFGKKVRRKIDVVKYTLDALRHKHRIWGYGAAGKATLWLNACRLDYLEAVVDESPLRVGKLIPGTHNPIVFPNEMKKKPPDFIFVTAWNYANLIMQKEKDYKGYWIIPLPELRIS